MILSSRSFLSALIWSLAAWILVMQLYMAFFPPQLVLFDDPRSHRRGGGSFVRTEERMMRSLGGGEGRYENLTMLEKEEIFKASSARNVSDFPDIGLVLDPVNAPAQDRNFFFPGRHWLDSSGNSIQAHGGGILYVPSTGIFYWYGENKDGPTYYAPTEYESLARVDLIGVSCYSSKDLWLWKYEGLVLEGDKEDESSDLYYKNVLERPKVIYNERSQQYVMWLHIDSANYTKASLGVAVSSRPEGPFEFLGSKQPHAFESRDMTVFKDEDGTAYVVYSSEGNSALHITPLQDDYLEFRNVMSRVFVDQHREAPAVFKHRGIYYMVTSDCTGWAPNTALVHVAENMLGPWETAGNPCVGGTSWFRSTTFFSQGSFVLPLPGLPNTFLFMADRWNSTELRHSRYVWLPLTVDGPVDEPVEGLFEFPFWWRVSIRWYSRWKLPVDWERNKQ
ncbi:uncharacterized protein LOC9638612 [Selaginella moellendorffii]|nr:uncharacterized protein LOC9638612 [Selaginella moellendorffii]|eukprot:XP_002988515.2 uncharacterized protein LOC9638612 [Selaginella moellendorffii]